MATIDDIRSKYKVLGKALNERQRRIWAASEARTPRHPARAQSVGSEGLSRSPARYLWAMPIARIYETFPLSCLQCGTQMRIIAFLTDTASVTRIIEHIAEPTKPPVLSPVPGPPAWEEDVDQTPVLASVAPAPEPVFELDQTVAW